MGFVVTILFVLFLVLVLTSIPLYREGKIARKAGMSTSTPVCGTCHYRFEGWTSSICPECGVDVMEVGVRIGPRTIQIWLGFLLCLVTFFAVTPGTMYLMGWIFETSSKHISSSTTSTVLPQFHVNYQTDYEWRRFPPKFKHDTALHLTYFMNNQTGGTWRNGMYVGNAATRQQTIAYTEETVQLSDIDVEQTVRVVLGANVSEENIKLHIQSIKSLMQTILEAQLHGKHTITSKDMQDQLFSSVGTGGSGFTSVSWHGFVMTLVIFVVSIWLSFRIPMKYCKFGWRKVLDNEWVLPKV